jgi:hypothetical protein
LCFVSQADFDAIGKSSPDIYRDVMKMLARRLRDTNNALAASSFLSVKGRVARALLNLAEAFGKDVGNGRILIRQKVNQSDLAAMADIARENVSRVLKDWMEHAMVSRLAGYYCLEKKDENDQRLLELCAQWQMARAQQEIIWAEQNFSRMDGSLPNEGIQPITEPLAKMCELQDTLASQQLELQRRHNCIEALLRSPIQALH